MTERKVELPIDINNVECVTECWTFNRLAILKTMPYYEDWIASHYDLYTTSNFSFFFGRLQIYTPDYYDIVLERKSVNLFNLTEKTVVKKLKEELLNGYYLIMHIKPFEDEEWYHEVLIYGFDDCKGVFYCIGLENRIFQKREYDYEYIENTLNSIKGFVREHNSGMGLALQFQYTLSAFKPRNDYSTENCVFEAYRKVKNEFFGGHYLQDKIIGFGEYRQNLQLYRGIHCLDAVAGMLRKIMNGEELPGGFQGIVNAFRKLYEHRYMMIISMRYVLHNWAKAINLHVVDCISDYEECSKTVLKWERMVIKYEFTHQGEILGRILEEIPDVYEIEQNCLDKFVNNSIDWDMFHKYYV